VHVVPSKAVDVEVTRLSEDLIITPARDVATPEAIPQRNTASSATPAILPAEKRPLIARLNPFGGKSNQPESRTATAIAGDSRVASQASSAASSPRYAFLNPRPGIGGNRAEATRALAEGVKAHQLTRLAQAASLYERAAQYDPAFFEAHHNLGLALLDAGSAKRALPAFENALALRPDSADARYNFALALKQANHVHDAAEQLERILRSNPDDTRAHLSLGNLYAQKLNQPQRAREHYGRVLEKNPQHPQAAEIRLWLGRSRG
jgi:tetratricopeptide (TPR) repeat protein